MNINYMSNKELLSNLLCVKEEEVENFNVEDIIKNPQKVAGDNEKILIFKELVKRINEYTPKKLTVSSPEDVVSLMMPRLKYEQKENFCVILLDIKNHLLSIQTISVGSLTASVVHPREVFKAAVLESAASMILVHNHPSCDPTPSREDVSLTNRMVKAGELMNIPVFDHIIVGGNEYVSMKEKGLIA